MLLIRLCDAAFSVRVVPYWPSAQRRDIGVTAHQPESGQAAGQRVLANFIGGEYRPARDGRTSDVVDPSTGETYLEAPVSGPADVDEALTVAAEAFESWRDATP